MKIMLFTIWSCILLSCNNPKIVESDYELTIINNNYNQKILISDDKLSVKIYNDDLISLDLLIDIDKIKIDSLKVLLDEIVLKNKTNDKGDFSIKNKNGFFYLMNNTYLMTSLNNFDNNIELTRKLSNALDSKVKNELKKHNFDIALKLAEASVYLRRPFYKGIFKDDRRLKVLSQKSLYNSGKKEEAINNLLRLN